MSPRGGAREGAGHPSNGTEPMTTRLPQIRMGEVELQHLRESAAYYAMTISDYVRWALAEHEILLASKKAKSVGPVQP